MTFEHYKYIYTESLKIRERSDIRAAIEKQTALSKEVHKKADIRFGIEDKLFELYHSISTDKIDTNLFGGPNVPEHERLAKLIEAWIIDDPKTKPLKQIIIDSGKDVEIGELEQKLEEAIFDYFLALIKLDTSINESRQNLFSKEYKKKMKEYAEKGVLLYYLETPDLPILSKDISSDDILELLSFDNYQPLYPLFYGFLSQSNPSPSMRRKTEDIIGSINCLMNEDYRSAARTVFALLESEHKNCSKAMDDYFILEERAKNGKERAIKIQQLLNGLKTFTYFDEVWHIVNPIYKGILNSKIDSFIDRNSIIHGDYYSDKLDICGNDVVKLLLLYLNMRMISDHIQLYCEMLQKTINYTEIHIAQHIKNKAK